MEKPYTKEMHDAIDTLLNRIQCASNNPAQESIDQLATDASDLQKALRSYWYLDKEFFKS